MYVFLWILCCLCNVLHIAKCYPEQGKWDFDFPGYAFLDQSVVVTKSLYRGGKFVVSITCKGPDPDEFTINATWYLRKAACWKEYYETYTPIGTSATNLFHMLEKTGQELANETSYYIQGSETHICDNLSFDLVSAQKTMQTDSNRAAAKRQQLQSNHGVTKALPQTSYSIAYDGEAETPSLRVRRDGTTVAASTGAEPLVPTSGADMHDVLYEAGADGIYQLILGTRPAPVALVGTQNHSCTITIHIEIYNDYGYLSAADYPLLVFYSTMCVIYVAFGVGWLTVSFLQWRELLRVQYWIGAVILLGMLEKAVFTAEYESVNTRGRSIRGLIVFAELVSCLKRTLSRMLVIIVSFGFGIVKPRLGVVLHRVVAVGAIYFTLASIEGCMRALRPKISSDEYSKRLLFAIVPLALLESAICWWVFSALVSTTRTLRLRRNTVKLALFRHFTNTLAFAVVASVIFMLWSIRYQNFDPCLSDWKQLWVNDAFWHVLFATLLLIIMILWRPTNNNQRFAFSPLLDDDSEGADEEEQEKLMANVSDTMKLRSKANSDGFSSRDTRSVEDDLRWMEENIPSSITDTGLPVMDSDEEIMTTKFEISKMQ